MFPLDTHSWSAMLLDDSNSIELLESSPSYPSCSSSSSLASSSSSSTCEDTSDLESSPESSEFVCDDDQSISDPLEALENLSVEDTLEETDEETELEEESVEPVLSLKPVVKEVHSAEPAYLSEDCHSKATNIDINGLDCDKTKRF